MQTSLRIRPYNLHKYASFFIVWEFVCLSTKLKDFPKTEQWATLKSVHDLVQSYLGPGLMTWQMFEKDDEIAVHIIWSKLDNMDKIDKIGQ